MKKHLGFLVLLAFLGLSSYGQITFQKVFGRGVLASCGQTNDGGYILLKNNNDTILSSLIKLNANGDTAWTKILEFAAYSYESWNTIRQSSDGGYIISISSYGEPADFGLLVKTDSAANILW